jgi:hypothetical protein
MPTPAANLATLQYIVILGNNDAVQTWPGRRDSLKISLGLQFYDYNAS